jgi:hypothetical protein
MKVMFRKGKESLTKDKIHYHQARLRVVSSYKYIDNITHKWAKSSQACEREMLVAIQAMSDTENRGDLDLKWFTNEARFHLSRNTSSQNTCMCQKIHIKSIKNHCIPHSLVEMVPDSTLPDCNETPTLTSLTPSMTSKKFVRD